MKKVVFSTIIAIILCLVLFGCSPRIEEKHFVVTFDEGEGKTTKVSLAEIPEPKEPEKEGYVFDGWYKSDDETKKNVDFPYYPDGNITLCAKYTDISIGSAELVFEHDEEGRCCVTGYNGKSKNVVIPDLHADEEVQKISFGTFRFSSDIEKIYFGKNLKFIEEKLYNLQNFSRFILYENSDFFSVIDGILYNADKTELISVPRAINLSDGVLNLPSSTVKIANYSLRYVASIEKIKADNIEIIGEKFAYLPNLRAIEISGKFSSSGGVLFDKEGKTLLACPVKIGDTYAVPDNVSSISEGAFNDCLFSRLRLGASVKNFEVQERLTSLVGIEVSADNKIFRDVDGVLFKGEELVLYPAMREGSAYKAECEIIGNTAFANSRYLKTLTVSAKTKTVSMFAFLFSSVEEIIFEEGSQIETFDEMAFYSCEELSSITMTANIPPTFNPPELPSFNIIVPAAAYSTYCEAWEPISSCIAKLP